MSIYVSKYLRIKYGSLGSHPAQRPPYQRASWVI